MGRFLNEMKATASHLALAEAENMYEAGLLTVNKLAAGIFSHGSAT